MSREIKFRAWVGSENTSFIDMPSHYEYDVVLKDGCYADVESGWDIQGVFSLVPIEQYTGLKDKNGKEIYEGDIVKGEMGVFEVRWYDAIASFCFKPNTEMTWHPNCNQGTTDYMEIVGNIHENPELLEGKNE